MAARPSPGIATAGRAFPETVRPSSPATPPPAPAPTPRHPHRPPIRSSGRDPGLGSARSAGSGQGPVASAVPGAASRLARRINSGASEVRTERRPAPCRRHGPGFAAPYTGTACRARGERDGRRYSHPIRPWARHGKSEKLERSENRLPSLPCSALADLPTSDPGREVPLEAVGASLEDLRGMREQMAVSWSLPGALYLLDVFQKKSSTGIRTPRRDLDRILARWRRASDHHGIHYGDG